MRHNFAAEAIPVGRAKALAAFGLAVMAAFLLLIGLQAATTKPDSVPSLNDKSGVLG